jgi:hypothetical protein
VRHASTPNRTADNYPLGGIAFGNDMYVVMNRLFGNGCLVSADATNWSAMPLQSGADYVEMDRVYANNGMFVAGGIVNNAAILSSSNGVNWAVYSSPLPGGGINDIAYGAGRWVGVCDLAGVITSTNASSWTTARVSSALVQAHVHLHGIVYSGGLFVTVGDSGTVLTSPDGLEWTPRTSPGGAAMNAVTLGNGSPVAVGLSGTVWQSGPMLDLDIGWQTDGARLTLSSPSGLNCVVQTSSDLMNWTDLFPIPVTQPTQTFVDTNALASPLRFYRAKTQSQ